MFGKSGRVRGLEKRVREIEEGYILVVDVLQMQDQNIKALLEGLNSHKEAIEKLVRNNEFLAQYFAIGEGSLQDEGDQNGSDQDGE